MSIEKGWEAIRRMQAVSDEEVASMATDTKAVARWYNNRAMGNMFESVEGNYVLFTDHERVVGELRADIEMYAQCEDDEVAEVARRGLEITRLRAVLAASRAEVEGLKKDAERYRWLIKNWQFDKEAPVSLCFDVDGLDDTDKADAAIDAAMENGNV